jgi:hypothetical protein
LFERGAALVLVLAPRYAIAHGDDADGNHGIKRRLKPATTVL